MKILSKMTPLMLATFLLAPTILIDQAKARENNRREDGQERNREPRNPGDRGDTTTPRDRDNNTAIGEEIGSRGRVLPDRDFGNWDRRYLGKRSFRLIDDQEIKEKSDTATQLTKELAQKTTALDKKEEDLKKVLENKTKIEADIQILSKKIVDGVSEKADLEKRLPNLKNQLKGLSDQVKVAQAAAENTQAAVKKIQASINSAQKELKAIEDLCAATPAADCQAKITTAKNKVEEAKSPLREANQINNVAKRELNKKLELRDQKSAQVTTTTQRITTIGTEITEFSNQITQKETVLNTVANQVKAERNLLRPIKMAYANTLRIRNQAVTSRDQLKEIMITRILRLNSIGSSVGEEAGSIDGDYYAEYIGIPEGQRDGDRDGTQEGTRVGQDRSYNRGFAQGEVNGRAEADAIGKKDGTRIGTIQGNTAAATEAGDQDGFERAEVSDAASVGQTAGRTSGLDRAVKTGKKIGEAAGENQAINKNEGTSLNDQNVNGDFAGAFAAITPDYPGFNCIEYRGRRYNRDDYGWRGQRDWRPDHQICPNFRPRKHAELSRTNRPILREAFMDGYLVSYRMNRRGQFNQSIDRYYLSTYQNMRDAAYSEFSRREYSSYTNSGLNDGFETAYNANYPLVKEEYREIAFSQFSANPNTDSGEYRETYSQVELASYNKRYEEIRVQNFNSEEQQTFDTNIEEQTEKFRKSRYAAVEAIYKNHPVLKYVSSSMADGGIDDVAKADGVYMPGEATLHSITIKNFGEKGADNVTVRLEDGSTFKVANIAAKSTTTIKGAAKGKVSNGIKIGDNHTSSVRVYSPLTAEAKIQGRHYYAASSGKLNLSDDKSVKVSYPLNLGGLAMNSELLINSKNGLKVTLSNNSKRNYTGPLKVELNVNSANRIITSEFETVNSLKTSQTLKDASVLVASEADVYKSLNFSAKVYKNGVLLGILNNGLNTMAKAPYKEKSGKPVLLIDSDKNPEDIIVALNSLKGLSNASVIDISLSRLNRDVLANGLSKKMIVALDDLRGSSLKGVAAVLKNSEDSVLLFVDSRNQGISIAKRSNVMKNSVTLPVHLTGAREVFNLAFTNPYLDGVKEMQVVGQTTPDNMMAAINTLSGFMKTNNELVADAGRALSDSNILQTQSSVQNMITMASGEIMVINQAYKSSNSERFISEISSGNTIYKKVLEASGKKVKRSNLSQALAAISMYNVINRSVDHFDPMDDLLEQEIERKVEDEMRDVIKGSGLFRLGKGTLDNLKKFDSRLYNKVDENPYTQSPFKL